MNDNLNELKVRIVIGCILTGLFAPVFNPMISAQQTASGARLSVNTSVRNDTSQSLQSLKSSMPKIRAAVERHVIPAPRLNPKRANAAFTRPRPDPVLQSKEGPAVLIKVIASVDGLGKDFPNTDGDPMQVIYSPPDTNGVVGDTQYVQTVNTYFAVFNKADLIKAGAKPTKPAKPTFGWAPIDIIWHGFGGKCERNDDGDPIVQYDKIAKRWVITQLRNNPAGFGECIAVSATSDATGGTIGMSLISLR